MIRNVVFGRARPDADAAAIDAGLAGIAALRLSGHLSVAVCRDVGLRAAGWTFAITNHWVGGTACHGYDMDPEHNLYRDQIAAQCSEVAGCSSR